MMSRLYTSKSTQLSNAWAELFLELMKPGVGRLSPVVVTIRHFDNGQIPIEDPNIRRLLDDLLQANHVG